MQKSRLKITQCYQSAHSLQTHQQGRPGQQVVMPGRQQFVVANPVARQTSAVRVQSQYASAAQPLEVVETEGNYPVAASRKSYASAVRP